MLTAIKKLQPIISCTFFYIPGVRFTNLVFDWQFNSKKSTRRKNCKSRGWWISAQVHLAFQKGDFPSLFLCLELFHWRSIIQVKIVMVHLVESQPMDSNMEILKTTYYQGLTYVYNSKNYPVKGQTGIIGIQASEG